MSHETLFGEPKPSAHSCKKERSVLPNTPKCISGRGFFLGPDPLVGWCGDTLPNTHFSRRDSPAFGARHFGAWVWGKGANIIL